MLSFVNYIVKILLLPVYLRINDPSKKDIRRFKWTTNILTIIIILM